MTDFIRFTAGGRTFKGELADTPAARAFRKVLPAKLPMLELNGNEKYFHFRDRTFPAAPAVHAKAGDVMLYQDDYVVIFYMTPENSPYTYTRIGRITDTKDLIRALGSGNVDVSWE